VIVVDNGSVDDSVSMVRKEFSEVILVELTDNIGFARGNKLGLDVSSGSFIALVNNDVVLEPQWVDVMLQEMMDDPDVGICASKLVRMSDGLIDSVGDYFTTAFGVARPGEGDPPSCHPENRDVPGACAAAVFYRKSMIAQIGFLDEDFFLNHEDTDLNLRAWLAGWKCRFVHDAVALHHVSSSIGVMSDTYVYYTARNSLWVWLKNVPTGSLLRFLPHRIFYELVSFASYCGFHGKWRPFVKGKIASLQGVPDIIKKRKIIQKQVTLSTKDFHSKLVPILPYLRGQFRRVRSTTGKRQP